jgi:hypothetical protein
MTTIHNTAIYGPFDRAVIRMSLSALRWARARAESSAVSPERHQLLMAADHELRNAQQSAALLAPRPR